MEDKTNKEPDVRQPDEDVIEIDWMGILRTLWSKRKTLLKAMGVGLVVGIIIALSIPKKYTVSVTLSPELGQSSNTLSSLTSMVGLSSASLGEDALGAALSADIVASTPFLLELFDIQVSQQNESPDTTLVAYMSQQSVPWWGFLMALPGKAVNAVKSLFSDEKEASDTINPFQLTEEQSQLVETLRRAIVAEVDKKTYKTTLAVTLQDPVTAAVVADSVTRKLQTYIITYRSKKAQEDCEYLEKLYQERQSEYYDAQQKYAAYVDANQNVVLQKVNAHRERLQNDMNLAYQVYSQVATQLQMARAKVQETKPVFAVVEPATVPLQPSGLSRKVIVVAFVFLAFCGSAAWLLYGADLWAKFCEEIKKPVEKK